MNLIDSIRHRLIRIWQSYFPKPLSEDENEQVHLLLDEPLLSLFYSQPLCDQRHGLLVLEKCKAIFADELDPGLRPSENEMVLASFFHDVAKKHCKFSATQRVIFATVLIFIPNRSHDELRNSKCKIIRRIGVYVDHAQLSFELIKSYTDSAFVKNVTLHHHGIQHGVQLNDIELRQIELFVQADTL